MSDTKKDYLFYSIVIVFSMFFLLVTPQIKSTNTSFIVGPRDWPFILLIGMLGLSVFGIIKNYVKSKMLKTKSIKLGDKGVTREIEQSKTTIFRLSTPMVSLAAIIIYVILLNGIGFILSTIIFLLGITLLLGQKKILSAAIFSIVTTTVFVLLFTRLLQIPLPRGFGVFRIFSLLFY